MTISEIEQGIRNLIATQPSVLSGAMGEVVRGVLSIVESYRDFSIRVQTYPGQDMLKFSLVGESQKMEETVSNLVSLVLQERGINISLYTPNGAEYGTAMGQMNMNKNGFGSGKMEFNKTATSAPNSNRFNMDVANKPQMGVPHSVEEDADFSVGELEDVEKTLQGEQSTDLPSGRPMFAEGEDYNNGNESEPVDNAVNESSDQGGFDFPIGRGQDKPASSEGRDYLLELLKK